MLFHCTVTINQQYDWLRIQSSMQKLSTWRCIITSSGKKVLQDEVELRYIKMDEQVADLFTKNLVAGKFENFLRQLSIAKRMEAGVEGEC